MSRIFYDHLIVFEKVEKLVRDSVHEEEEKAELFNIIDETVHHSIFDAILTVLDKTHHDEFMDKFHTAPHDHTLVDYLNEKTNGKAEEAIKKAAEKLEKELLNLVKKAS